MHRAFIHTFIRRYIHNSIHLHIIHSSVHTLSDRSIISRLIRYMLEALLKNVLTRIMTCSIVSPLTDCSSAGQGADTEMVMTSNSVCCGMSVIHHKWTNFDTVAYCPINVISEGLTIERQFATDCRPTTESVIFYRRLLLPILRHFWTSEYF